MTSQMRKAIMKRSRLKNKANKSGKLADKTAYKTQRNLVVKLNKEAKKSFLKNQIKENATNKRNQKVHVLARITPHMSIPKSKLLMNSFFISQFNYCPLVWTCHSRLMNNKINRLHKKCFHIAYSDKTSSFEELLDKGGSVTLHTRNLQVLATEMFTVYRNLSPNIVAEIFCSRQNNYNLTHSSFFSIPSLKLSITVLRVYRT